MIVFPWFAATIRCSAEVLMIDLKEALFDALKRMAAPEFSFCPADYIFRFFSFSEEFEYVLDEETPIGKLDLPFPFPILFLHEPDGLIHEKELIRDIDHALGFALDEEMEMNFDDELRQYRTWLFSIVRQTVEERGSEGFDHYAFPEETVLGEELPCPRSLTSKIRTAGLSYKFFYRSRENEEKGNDNDLEEFQMEFQPDYTPCGLVELVLAEVANSGEKFTGDTQDEEFILQLVGQNSYLTSATILMVSYKSVRAAFESYQSPKFVLRRKSIVLRSYPRPRPLFIPHYVKKERKVCAEGYMEKSMTSSSEYDWVIPATATTTVTTVSLWDVDENLSIRPQSCLNLGSADIETQISVEFTVYCGRTILVRKSSKLVQVTNPRWSDDFIPFDLYMKDLPPSAVLGVKLIEWRSDPKRKDKEKVEISRELGWYNMSLADWKDELRQGQISMILFSSAHEPANTCRIGESPGKVGTTRLNIEIASFGKNVKLPSPEQYEWLMTERLKWAEMETSVEYDYVPPEDDEEYSKVLDLLRIHSSGGKIEEDDECILWKWRYFLCEKHPDSLVTLAELDMVWRMREKFSELYVLVSRWKSLSIGAALTLLGKRCTDRVLRRYAVEQLDKMLGKHTFPLYILPLVQALKSEPRAQSDVARLLLRKALSDYRIGHKLFWLLRAEIADLRDVEFRLDEFHRLALLIEAYLRGNEEHVRTVVKQVDMMELLSKLSVVVKGSPKDVATKRFREDLRAATTSLEYIDSPLDPTYTLGELIVEKCKVLGSAKMPMRLAWRNVSPLAEHHIPVYEILFKNGDDLRQDMLVLQVLEVMDTIWKVNELECFLSPYPVLPMGTKIGIIGVVANCATIFEIQSEGGKVGTAVKSLETTFLNKFVRTNAATSKDYLESVDKFMMSCVGYSVATFIMGIKDRHSDNIMLTYDGKLFHIDFGHILGHGKTKLGIQRDRQPFVLTEHFLCVIRKGKAVTKQTHEVSKFKQLTIDSYLMLWEKRNLFESLFSLMQGMELPELSTAADLDHLKKTICAGTADREEAKSYFTGIFEEAFNGSWSTKTNWFFHAVKHL